MGDKDPVIARQQSYYGFPTVRGKFSDPNETLQKSVDEKYGTKNVGHASDCLDGAVYELGPDVWRKFFEKQIKPCSDPIWGLLELGDAIASAFYKSNKKD